MRKLLILSTIFALSACGGSNDDGSSKSTYSSCKITSSQALFAADRDNDLKQCWNAGGNGYESQGDAMQWCEKQVNAYIANQYLVGHTVSYAVESTNCK
ncbi:hypothetical protein [Pseudoalteromonas arctica]|uniref:Orphan protein n=1 Tax=Pseudoalteromonas arctica TaxID=394751 RepID=A0A7Y0DWD0_9GAMM|nr:hypothetical protein [Pseudoalteromonas arctica]NMM42807.1 hypothetical protein [Pseudoalteromonas arctica]